MDPLLSFAIVLYALISLILAFLAYTYARTFLSTRARYPLGLLIFSLLLLVQSTGTALGYASFAPFIGDRAYPFMAAMGVAELVGVVSLLRITL
jgi:hypothetical protein